MTRHSASMLLVGVALMGAACRQGPVAPDRTALSAVPASGPPEAAPVLTEVQIHGPATIARDATGQFTATAKYSDGSSEDVTSRATWNAVSGAFLTFITSGTAKGIAVGGTNVYATFGTITTSVSVSVDDHGLLVRRQ